MPTLSHGLVRMTGRDPREANRAATPLELLFDLAFVVAFGQAADQLAHYLAEGRIGVAIGAFVVSMFAICWAWINFSWFGSAYDTDDWFYRITTMVQMIGVVVLALGIPALFSSLEEGRHLDNGLVVAGYVVMRIAMVAQWLRAAKQDPTRRRTALSYATFIVIAQVGWVTLVILNLPVLATILLTPVLTALEIAGPVLSERRGGGTPWNAHHIAERYGLFAIIALGEGVFGTVASVAALVDHQGWSPEVVVVVVAGIGLTFGLWWNYFMLPSAPILERYRSRVWVWGYGHIFIYAAIAATGAGLHVAAYVIADEAVIGVVGAVLAVAIPVLVFMIGLFALYTFIVREGDPFHVALFATAVAALAGAVAAATAGASLGLCLVIITLAPMVVIVGYETVGHRHQAAVLERALR